MKNEHIESILWTFMIVVSFLLANYVEDNGKEMTCNQCTVDLYNKRPTGEYFFFEQYKIQDLYEEYYYEGTCTIKWDPTQGYQISHEKP